VLVALVVAALLVTGISVAGSALRDDTTSRRALPPPTAPTTTAPAPTTTAPAPTTTTAPPTAIVQPQWAALPPVPGGSVGPGSQGPEIQAYEQRMADLHFDPGPVDGVYGARTDTAIRDFEQALGMKAGAQPDEALLAAIARSPVRPASKPVAVAARPAGPHAVPVKPAAQPKRIIAVQRALADFGYGQMKPSGVMGADTKAAIERFERERKLPVTGQISDRLTRELAAVTGRPLE